MGQSPILSIYRPLYLSPNMVKDQANMQEANPMVYLGKRKKKWKQIIEGEKAFHKGTAVIVIGKHNLGAKPPLLAPKAVSLSTNRARI
ncbi:unnamed protein product [Camellia sinensis]